MNNTNSIKTKDSADILKFIMSVFVVATHTGLFSPHLTPLVRLAVPVFFVLSGYFFFSKTKTMESISQKKAYLKKSVKHNLQLYAFWFLVLSPITFYIRNYFSSGILSGLSSFIKDFFLGSTFQSSWYITALVICLIFIFFMSQKLNNFALIIIGVLFYIPALISSNYLFIAASSDTLRSVYSAFTAIFSLPCRNFFVGFIYIALGKILAEKENKLSSKKSLAACLICLVFLAFEYLALYFGRVHINNTDCFIMLPLTAFFICRYFLSLSITCSHSLIMRKLSTISYCLHMAVFMITGKFLSILDIQDFGNIIVFALTLILTWAIGLAIIKIEKYRIFGFLKYSH